MKSTKLNPAELAEAAAMRSAGYTLGALATRFNVSARTLQRQFKEHKVVVGSVTREVVENARADLITSVLSVQSLRLEVARLVSDDIATAFQIRNRSAEILDALSIDNHREATESARAVAALATTLRVTHEVLRRSLRLDSVQASLDVSDLPELIVRGLTNDEIEAIREQQIVEDSESADAMLHAIPD